MLYRYATVFFFFCQLFISHNLFSNTTILRFDFTAILFQILFSLSLKISASTFFQNYRNLFNGTSLDMRALIFIVVTKWEIEILLSVSNYYFLFKVYNWEMCNGVVYNIHTLKILILCIFIYVYFKLTSFLSIREGVYFVRI